MTVDLKPAKPYRATRAAWEAIPRKYRASYKPCPDCGGPMARHAFRCRGCSPLIRGENAAMWKGDGASTTTKRERAQKSFRLPEYCERCRSENARDRHHIDGNPGNNDPSNIAFLCRRCHMAVDGRLDALRAMAAAQRDVSPPSPCAECERPRKPLRRGLCGACYARARRAGRFAH